MHVVHVKGIFFLEMLQIHEEVASYESAFKLKRIHIENFKSYAGSYELSFPYNSEDLICVVGPNGSGKSNLMDAIAFCFNCADSSKLRGDGNIGNLVCTESGADTSSVTVELASTEPDASISFTRSIGTRGDSRYKLDGKPTTLEKYRDKMVECKLDVKGTFLVFQGDVEALALSNPKELAQNR